MNQTETLEKVKATFAEYQDKVEAILKDYLCDDLGMFTELAAADEGFLQDVADLDEKQSFEDMIDEVLDHPKKGVDDLLKHLDSDDVRKYCEIDLNCIILEVQGADDRDKLEAFIKQNIYPYNINDLWRL